MITLSTGLSDQSKELGESTTNTSPVRIRAYNDAVIDFADDRKWPFLVKENTDKSTVVGDNDIDISDITDMRFPGPIKEIYLGSSTTPYLPIDWEDRNQDKYSDSDSKYCYIKPDQQTIILTGDITSVETIHIWYYYLPERIEDTASSSSFPIPTKYRKIIATLGAAYVQWSRYLDAQGNRLFNMYSRMLRKKSLQQSERNDKNPRKLQHYLRHIGFRRTYR